MQRREQQRRAAAGGGPGGSYLGGGVTGYSPVPRFEAPSITPLRTSSPAPSSLTTPKFKGSGMKLGSKKSTQSALLDALGGEVLLSEDMSTPGTPAQAGTPEPTATAPTNERGSLPTVTPERCARSTASVLSLIVPNLADFFWIASVHVAIRETIRLELMREGGLNDLELKGDMNLQITDPALAKVKLALAPASATYGPELQFKQHPNVGKFSANRDRVVALKDPSRTFPVGQPLAVLKWRYAGKDETYVPLSSMLLILLDHSMCRYNADTSLMFLSQLLAGSI